MIIMIFLLQINKNSSKAESIESEMDFLVYKGNQAIRLSQNDIAYVLTSEKSTILVDTSGQQFLINTSLKTLENSLQPDVFFRLNRQIISNRKSIVSFEKLDTRKLKIMLSTDPGFPIYVSKSNASNFQNWLMRK